jgi:competence protein ComEA
MSAKSFYNVLYFTRKEKRGALVLLLLISLLCSIPFIIAFYTEGEMTSNQEFDEKIEAINANALQQKKPYPFEKNGNDNNRYPNYEKKNYSSKPSGILFEFDPNTIDEAGWKRLGLRDKTIGTIINFRNKGGKFKTADDIEKIWGLFPDEAARLKPYVRIAARTEPDYKSSYKPYKPYEKPAIAAVDINTADTSALMALPGIGAKLSARILQFRNKLGGFHSVEQVKETYALHDSVFQKIAPYLKLHTGITPININEATIDQLKAHPYIRYHLANAIVQYRTQHGAYRTIEDVKKIMIVDEQIFAKVAPYLTVY